MRFLHTTECTGVFKNETKVSSQLKYHVIMGGNKGKQTLADFVYEIAFSW